ncbi:MAG: 4-(cytidine 5'-diphospho)-2-C-methyl-D-erythritol kinase [Fusobacterium sp.]|nr:4-(cytidine 5'-diphospho)-2-C-methyl-D-erythritol kinase [Fusobacterium sp.]
MIFLNRYVVHPNAKINLGLNVFEKYKDGYHELDTIMLPISIEDELDVLIFDKKGNLNITCTDKKIPTDEKNILYKTYKKFFEKIKKEEIEIRVHLKKIIPCEAGLGGGSADAGFFLKILNDFYNSYFTIGELEEIALEIGSDVPFFIRNKSSRIRNKGEKIDILENNISSQIVVIKPEFGISTKLAYENFDKLQKIKYSNFDEIIKSIKENNIYLLEKNIENCLEQAIENNSDTNLLKSSLKAVLPNKRFFMSGSGSSFYTFVSKDELDFVETRLRTFLDGVQIFICNIKK